MPHAARIDALADPKARNSADFDVPADKVNGAIAPVFILLPKIRMFRFLLSGGGGRGRKRGGE